MRLTSSMDKQALPDSPGKHDSAQSAESALLGVPSQSAQRHDCAPPIR